ncbi:MAG: IS66 family insertion sequence element accessory protein TnpB [Candidatus Dechloromonas phosphoritropha]|nr:IS66 family insertion sequence element accessory protein TnpB [Candidatus Dechloromonas phosphoritropha]MBL0351443.1 IS66 family insertion sequence element accessory protein TnpB [Candidatus Dechloromonas phosphoritropha]MBL0351488.1 IS66 family insertion sequence element accessory protein TnpB [Candidatus Dechloromonas phosphoritropha]MBL0351598.1 IS66 family insertion sequence element accessory protein TnpB [Candidatus Dechloromonas phosphoritropha]MBL0351612.1 IS66 family insertion sequen
MAKAGEGSRVRRSASEWEALLSRFPGSGLNVATFCKREGISDTSFHRWRTRLGIALDSQDKASGQPATFVDVGPLSTTTATPARFHLTLDLGGGLILQLERR